MVGISTLLAFSFTAVSFRALITALISSWLASEFSKSSLALLKIRLYASFSSLLAVKNLGSLSWNFTSSTITFFRLMKSVSFPFSCSCAFKKVVNRRSISSWVIKSFVINNAKSLNSRSYWPLRSWSEFIYLPFLTVSAYALMAFFNDVISDSLPSNVCIADSKALTIWSILSWLSLLPNASCASLTLWSKISFNFCFVL